MARVLDYTSPNNKRFGLGQNNFTASEIFGIPGTLYLIIDYRNCSGRFKIQAD